jgi:hypothetical protein
MGILAVTNLAETFTICSRHQGYTHVHQYDSRISSDPTNGKHEVAVLCLILITLKRVAAGIRPSDSSVIPTIKFDRIQNYVFRCDSESPNPTGNQPNSVGWLNLQDPLESGTGLMDLAKIRIKIIEVSKPFPSEVTNFVSKHGRHL